MRLPRGIVRRGARYFARIHTKGGEKSFRLGPVSDLASAVQKFYTIRALIRQGTSASAIKDALNGDGLGLLTTAGKVQAGPEVEITVAEAARRWIREHVEPDLEDGENIKSRVDRLLLPFIGSKPISEVRRADCHAFKGHIRATYPRHKPGTLVHDLRLLRELLAWAENVELIPESPWPRKGIMPRIKKRPPDRLTDEEVEILTTLPEPWRFNLRLAIETGCRWSELTRLERTDITADGQLLIREAKGGKFRRVPIPRWLVAEIMRRRGRLFVKRTGKPYSETSNGSFNATIRRLARKHTKSLSREDQERLSGLKRFHVHMTRHTFGCRYVEAGGELTHLQQIMGHESITTTQIYARPNEKAIRADAQRVYAVQEARSQSNSRS